LKNHKKIPAAAADSKTKIENFSAAAAKRQKKIEIFEPPPPIKASAYTSSCE
jgi:hypothetical protein